MTGAPHFKRRVVRASKPSWSYAPASGEGAARHCGRFNPKGMAALYTSFDFTTCAHEVRFSLNTDPYTFYYLDVESANIADLSSRTVRESLGISWSDLECPTWEAQMNKGLEPSSHRLAGKLIKLGWHGIIVPSFAPGSVRDDLNLVLWKWKSVSEHASKTDYASVIVLNPDLLPKDQSSWDE